MMKKGKRESLFLFALVASGPVFSVSPFSLLSLLPPISACVSSTSPSWRGAPPLSLTAFCLSSPTCLKDGVEHQGSPPPPSKHKGQLRKERARTPKDLPGEKTIRFLCEYQSINSECVQVNPLNEWPWPCSLPTQCSLAGKGNTGRILWALLGGVIISAMPHSCCNTTPRRQHSPHLVRTKIQCLKF